MRIRAGAGRRRLAGITGQVSGAVAMLLLLPALAAAQAPEPVTPGDGHQHVAGSPPPTFNIAPGAGNTDYLWVHVSRSPAPDSSGIIGSDVTLASFTSASPACTPASYTFPSYWLVTPGTYYWQPFRISYSDDPDGYQEGAIRRLEVVPAPPPPINPPPVPQDPYAGLSTELIPSYVGRRAPRFRFSVST